MEINNLILVYPKSTVKSDVHIPVSLIYLANVAKNICRVKLYDENVENVESLHDVIQSLNGQTCVAINCLFTAVFSRCLEIAAEIKASFPNIPIMVGGMHPTIFGEEIIKNCKVFDAVAIGEYDDYFPALLKYFFEKKGGGINSIVSAYVRKPDDSIHYVPRDGYIQNLDDYPPDYSILDFSKYKNSGLSWFYSSDNVNVENIPVSIITSRSCPQRCNFCSMRLVMGDRTRMRSAESVFSEIKMLYDVYGINFFLIMDDNFTLNRSRTSEILQKIIGSGMNIGFEAPNGLHIKSLDENIIALMKQAGFLRVTLSVESGSDEIRTKVIGKPIPRDVIIQAFEWTRKYGIKTAANFMVGFPEDTRQTLEDTYNLINEIQVDKVDIFKVQPFRGTKLYEQVMRDGLLSSQFLQDEFMGNDVSGDDNRASFLGRTLRPVQDEEFYIRPYSIGIDELRIWYAKIKEAAKEKSLPYTKYLIEKQRAVYRNK